MMGAGGTTDLQGGLLIAAALRTRGPTAGELYATARLVAGITQSDGRGQITIGEQSGAVGIRVLGPGRLRLGGAAELGARWLHAEGTTAQGTMGARSAVVPTVSLGPELRLDLRPGVELRTAIAAEVALWRQRFALNDVPVLDLGRFRALGSVSFLVVFP